MECQSRTGRASQKLSGYPDMAARKPRFHFAACVALLLALGAVAIWAALAPLGPDVASAPRPVLPRMITPSARPDAADIPPDLSRSGGDMIVAPELAKRSRSFSRQL
jgi:hypothetical protein